MPHRNTWTGRTAIASPDTRARATDRAAAAHHAQTHVATAGVPAMPQSFNSLSATATTTSTATSTTITTATTTTITTMITSTNASATASAEQEMITSNMTPITNPALISFANQALDIVIPFINRLNQMQDRNVYLVAMIMGFYHDLLTTDEEAETINAVARELKELCRDLHE